MVSVRSVKFIFSNARELLEIQEEREKHPELSDYFDKYEKNLKRESNR